MNKKLVLVTGGNGFLGTALINRFNLDQKFIVRSARRQVTQPGSATDFEVEVGDINSETDWSDALKDVAVVIHTAARVHVMKELVSDSLAEYRKVNVGGSLNLAKQAAKAGVKRFIFVSSVKVNGEHTKIGSPFTEDDIPSPLDPYGISKFEAEMALLAVGREMGIEIVIIRPVLVYGPGVKANFHVMMKWLSRGVILPFGGVENRRSFISIGNLVDLLVTCIEHPAAKDQIFLASDGQDMSTNELLKLLGQALGQPARLIYIPIPLLKAVAYIFGKGNVAQRLLGSLQVSSTKAQILLGWKPPFSVKESLSKTAAYFNENRK